MVTTGEENVVESILAQFFSDHGRYRALPWLGSRLFLYFLNTFAILFAANDTQDISE